MEENKELEFATKIAQLEQDKSNLTSELIETRKKKQDVEGELSTLKSKETPTGDVEEVVRKIIEERNKETLDDTKKRVFEEFKNSRTEFNPQNDPSGLKYQVFEEELSKFNLDNLKTESDISKRLKDVYDFMNRGKKTDDTMNIDPSISSGGSDPKTIDPSQLTSKENEVIKRLGWSVEQYLKQKQKNPDYILSLFRSL